MFKIMIVEDDDELRKNIKQFLELKGYAVDEVKDFTAVDEYLKNKKFDLLLLDINLPYDNGLYICSSIRRRSQVPIIFISARNRDIEQVTGMELGADDYVTKPFSLEVLTAKIGSILRRYNNSIEYENTELYGLQLDVKSFKLSYKENTIELSKNEFKLIKKFLENPDKVIPREELLKELWDDNLFVDDNTLTVNVTRIKNALSSINIKNVIKTKRGYGYIFDTIELKRGVK